MSEHGDIWESGFKAGVDSLSGQLAAALSRVAAFESGGVVPKGDVVAAEARIATLQRNLSTQAATIVEVVSERDKLREFIDKAFQIHPNLDLDVEALDK